MCLKNLFGKGDCTMLLFFIVVLLILSGNDNDGCDCGC